MDGHLLPPVTPHIAPIRDSHCMMPHPAYAIDNGYIAAAVNL